VSRGNREADNVLCLRDDLIVLRKMRETSYLSSTTSTRMKQHASAVIGLQTLRFARVKILERSDASEKARTPAERCKQRAATHHAATPPTPISVRTRRRFVIPATWSSLSTCGVGRLHGATHPLPLTFAGYADQKQAARSQPACFLGGARAAGLSNVRSRPSLRRAKLCRASCAVKLRCRAAWSSCAVGLHLADMLLQVQAPSAQPSVVREQVPPAARPASALFKEDKRFADDATGLSRMCATACAVRCAV
jgi:hypothetical protein